VSRERNMKWRTPNIVEIAVGLEINAYACAEIK
jgi:coenzyme PQQ precursor peptide PqqA